MRKHNKKRINIKKLLFFSLLSFTVVLALFFGVKRIYSYFQDKEYQEKIEALISKEEKNYASNTEKKSRQEGSHYIETFYPLRDGQVNSIVKEMMDADCQTIKNDHKKDSKIDQLTFYYSEEKDTSLTDVKEVLVHRKDYQAKNRKISPAETRQIAWSYLGSDGNRFTLDKVFQDAEVAKEVLLSEISSQLTFRRIDETAQTEVLNSMSTSDLSQWNFRYENSHFSISLPREIQGLTSIDVPLSSLYNQINPSFLKGADLEAYQNCESKRHEKMVALTFDDGPDGKTTPQALDILKKYGVKATFFMLGQNVVSNPDIVKRVKMKVIKLEYIHGIILF
ncbi:Peptidoglycan N-acetylglucosamine deacetylase [Streptococcus gordonii]|uniref:Peptidoglycan N-acetylglucosamine deacetylase n=1 Tax=Streptococcus gordonii TaxID=1302 RepID=A0A139N8J2_STRGN|nr:Peptidoglycan N-acetylglucosamine deacetylase [Streptococcus gordonii]